MVHLKDISFATLYLRIDENIWKHLYNVKKVTFFLKWMLFYSTVVNMVAVVVIRKISYNENLLVILPDISVYLSYQAECVES